MVLVLNSLIEIASFRVMASGCRSIESFVVFSWVLDLRFFIKFNLE